MKWVSLVVITALLVAALYAQAGHTESHESGWFEYQYAGDDERVAWCNALGSQRVGVDAGLPVNTESDFYVHDRPGQNDVYGTGAVFASGGGTYLYLETNGIYGLQIGDASATVRVGSITQNGGPFAHECPKADSLIIAL